MAINYKSVCLILSMTGLFIYTSCNKENTNTQSGQEIDKKEETTQTSNEEWTKEDAEEWGVTEEELTFEQKVPMLYDSLISYREKAFTSEKNKLDYALMIIEDLKVSGVTLPEKDVNDIKKYKEEASKAMYDSTTLGSEDTMIKYDEKTEQLTKALQNLKANTKDFDRYTRAVLLYNRFIGFNNQDLIIRKEYNYYGIELNKIIRNQQDKLKKSVPQYANLKPFPIFYGDEPQS